MIVAAGREGKAMHGNLTDDGRVRTVATEAFLKTYEPLVRTVGLKAEGAGYV